LVAIVGWGAAALLKENVRFFQAAENSGQVRPREWHGGSTKFRSLVLREDGSCELQRFSPAATAKRLGWSIAKKTARKVRMGQRG
jgi:hypothetical protein